MGDRYPSLKKLLRIPNGVLALCVFPGVVARMVFFAVASSCLGPFLWVGLGGGV